MASRARLRHLPGKCRQNGLSTSIDLLSLLKIEPKYFRDVLQLVPHGVEPAYSPEAFMFWVRSSSGCGTSIEPVLGRGLLSVGRPEVPRPHPMPSGRVPVRCSFQ